MFRCVSSRPVVTVVIHTISWREWRWDSSSFSIKDFLLVSLLKVIVNKQQRLSCVLWMCPLLLGDVFTFLYDVLGPGLPAFLFLLAAVLLPQSPWCFCCWRRRHKKALEMCSPCHNVSTREQICAVDNQCNSFHWIFLAKYFCNICAQAQDFFFKKVRILLHILILCEWIMVSL